MDYDDLIKPVLRVCREVVSSHLASSREPEHFGTNQFGDTIQSVDMVAERTLLAEIAKRFDSATIVSEESGIIKIGDGDLPLIVLDPVDGSTNAVKGYPCFSTSMAISEGNSLFDVKAGGVINLVTGDLFFAQSGMGAYLNEKRIQVSNVSRLGEAFVAADLNTKGSLPNYVRRISSVLERARHVRFLGTDALEMCLVASGAADAFVDLRGFIRITDIAASVLMIREAGGVVLSSNGSDLEMSLNPPLRTGFVACSTTGLFQEIIQLV